MKREVGKEGWLGIASNLVQLGDNVDKVTGDPQRKSLPLREDPCQTEMALLLYPSRLSHWLKAALGESVVSARMLQWL